MFDKYYFKKLSALFMPIFVINVGMYVMSLVDSLMLSYSKAEHVGLHSLGDTPITIILMIVSGLVQGVLFISSAADGQKNYPAAGQAFRQALRQGAGLSLLALPCYFAAPYLMGQFDYPAQQVQASTFVMQILSFSIPFAIVYFICSYFLNGIKRPWITMKFVLVANIVNLISDWILVNGYFGFPPLYSVGVACSTMLVRVFLGLGLLIYILYGSEFKQYKIRTRGLTTFSNVQKKLGLSATANMLSAELGSAFCLFFAGSISVMIASAYTITYRVLTLSQMISVSFAVAGSVLSGAFVNNNQAELNKIYQATMVINNLFMLPFCILLFFFSEEASYLMSQDEQLVTLLTPLMRIMALAMWLRGINSIQIILLRTTHDLLMPSLWYGAGFLVVLPLGCYILNIFFPQGYGIVLAVVLANLLITVSLSRHHFNMVKGKE